MKKLFFILLAFPLFLFSGCFGNGPLNYHNDIVGIENELAKIAEEMEPTLTKAVENSMKNEFDTSSYNSSISPLIISLDEIITKTNELGGYEGDDSIQKKLLASTNAIKYLLESEVPNVLIALTEKPEEAEELMKNFIERVGNMQKYDDDLKAALDAFDAKHEINVQ